ncbi:hypothetical protein [Thiorhodovibrio litoralis]|uniref:hypothetical protein n=1 Tax=Thiorhodovibrio litoralis TaxID=2952932 RepID=UPI002B25C476|nr:hypothetical protein [Thiorhodovibrio litoralis]WPL10449.1 hypothetical protein Thiosp_00164 [Thiorhodovibrio litoralis]
MLTTYFKHPFTLRKLRSGPGGPYLDDFAAQLAQSGYSRYKIRAHLRGAGRFSGWAAQAGVAIDALDADSTPIVSDQRTTSTLPDRGGGQWCNGTQPRTSAMPATVNPRRLPADPATDSRIIRPLIPR